MEYTELKSKKATELIDIYFDKYGKQPPSKVSKDEIIDEILNGLKSERKNNEQTFQEIKEHLEENPKDLISDGSPIVTEVQETQQTKIETVEKEFKDFSAPVTTETTVSNFQEPKTETEQASEPILKENEILIQNDKGEQMLISRITWKSIKSYRKDLKEVVTKPIELL